MSGFGSHQRFQQAANRQLRHFSAQRIVGRDGPVQHIGAEIGVQFIRQPTRNSPIGEGVEFGDGHGHGSLLRDGHSTRGWPRRQPIDLPLVIAYNRVINQSGRK